jgi:hypothetical protein
LKRLGILGVQAGIPLGHPAETGLSGADGEGVRPHLLDLLPDLLLRPLPQRHHRDDGPHPDDDAQGGEEGAEGIRPDGGQRDPERSP